MSGNILCKETAKGALYWDGQEWTSDKAKARIYANRDDILEKEKDNLEKINYHPVLQLFVFEDFCSDYSDGGMAFAIARDKDEAKDLIREQYKKAHDIEPEWGEASVWPLDKMMSAFVCGGG